MTVPRVCVALAAVGAVSVGGLSLAAHITPVVVLQKQADVMRTTLPDAISFFLTDVRIGREDRERIRHAGRFTIQDEAVKFYSGRNRNGETVGVVLFPQLDTPHGPIEVGLTLDPAGAIVSVVVTRATAEAKPWVERVIRSGGLARFHGLRHPAETDKALDVTTLHLDKMPAYFAGAIATAVGHGLVLYDILYASRAPAQSDRMRPANLSPAPVVE